MSELYTYTIFPIELIYKYIYLVLVLITDNYGWALFVLSLLNYFILIPLNKLVRGIQQSEDNMQQVLTPQLQRIREASRDAERHQRVQNLYQRYSYHPIFAIRSVFPLLVQLPFLMAVYFMLSSLENIEGVSFFFLQNLAKPDAVMFGYNIMPVVMTLVSLVNACFIVHLSKSQKRQAIIVSLLFFVLLYNAPSALLLYWTMNNVMILSFGLLNKVSILKRTTMFLLELKSRLLPSIINSTGLLICLFFVVPLYFTVSLNVNFFSEEQMVNFFIFLLATFCVCIVIGGVIDKMIRLISTCALCISSPCKILIKKSAQKGTFQVYFRDFIYLLLAFLAVYFITVLCINIKIYIDNYTIANIIRLCLAFFLFFVIRGGNLKVVNIAMLSMLAFCCVQFAIVQNKNIRGDEATKLLVDKAFADFPVEVKLQNKPNIYMIYIESYMSSKTLRDTYKYDNSLFENGLSDRGFQMYDSFYSHSTFTKGSLLTLLLMQNDITPLITGNQDVVSVGHEIIGGSKENLLFSYLKKNGYKISCYYDNQGYYFTRMGELLDHTIQRTDNSALSVLKNIAPSLMFKIRDFYDIFLEKSLDAPYVDIYPKAFQHIVHCADSSDPSFILLKPLNELHHTHRAGIDLSNFQKWTSSGIYQAGVTRSNAELLATIDVIEKSDPDALIILLGDHGHKYAVIQESYDLLHITPRELKSNYPNLNMSSEEFIDDMFSVFFAIKMPKSSKGELNVGSKLVYADLFRHIFAALDSNPEFVKYKSSDISINNKGVILRDGVEILNNGKQLDNE